MSEETKHIGKKGLALVLGIILAVIYTILCFVNNWLDGVTMEEVTSWLLGNVVLVILFPAVVYMADLLWSFADKAKSIIFA